MDPHEPYMYHKSFPFNKTGQKYKDGELIKATNDQLIKDVKVSKDKIIDFYDSEIALTDFYVGKMLESLKKNGLYDDSIIIITADHGEELGEHGRLGHGMGLYNEVTNIPLLIKLPKQKARKVITGSFSLIDLFPSLFKFAGIDNSKCGFVGRAYDLKNIRKMNERYIYALTNFRTPTESSMKDKIKYIKILSRKPSELLFNLNADHNEKKDISKININEFKVMQGSIINLEKIKITEGDDVSLSTNMNEESKKVLKSLGYLQ